MESRLQCMFVVAMVIISCGYNYSCIDWNVTNNMAEAGSKVLHVGHVTYIIIVTLYGPNTTWSKNRGNFCFKDFISNLSFIHYIMCISQFVDFVQHVPLLWNALNSAIWSWSKPGYGTLVFRLTRHLQMMHTFKR